MSGGAWRNYSGANPHTKHCHISVKQDASLYDDARAWVIDGPAVAPPAGVPAVVPQRPLLKRGAKGPEVARAQTLLNAHHASVHGARLVADAIFGKSTHEAVVTFQKASGLRPDGAIGPKTWALLERGRAPEKDPDALPARTASVHFDRIVKHYEGKAAKIYRIGGLLHGGYGHQLGDGEGWHEGDAIPEAQILAWYAADKALAEARVLRKIAVPLSQPMFDAVASIVWNGGDFDDPADLADSPLYWKSAAGILANLLNARDFAHVPACIRALGRKPARDGRIYRGIASRRLTEAERAEGLVYKLR